MSVWEPVRSIGDVPELKDLAADREVDEQILDWLLLAPESDNYIVSRAVVYQGGVERLDLLVPHTRLYFNASSCKTFWADAMTALIAFAITQNLSVSALIMLLRKVFEALKLLDDREAELVHVILGLNIGNPYVKWTPRDQIRGAYAESSIEIDELLEAVIDKGVLLRNGDMVRLVK